MLGGHPILEAVSSAAGAVNMTLSGARAGYHYLRGENEAAMSNLIDAGLSGGGILPWGGYAATLAKVERMRKGYDKTRKLGLAARKVDQAIGVVGDARHLQHVPSMVTGGEFRTGSTLNPELTGGGFGKDSDFRKQFKNPDLEKDLKSSTSTSPGITIGKDYKNWVAESGTHGGVFIGKAYNPKTGETERYYDQGGGTTSDVLTALTKWGKHPQKKK